MCSMRRYQGSGSVSVFLALTITLMLSFCMVFIESARENTMLLKADVVFEAAMQSVMAEYSVLLWEKYDLLYVDCGYEGATASVEAVKKRMQYYQNKNLTLGNRGWLQLDGKETNISEILLATDYNGKDFYLQAIEAGGAGLVQSYAEKLMSWFTQTEAILSDGEALQTDFAHISEQIEEVNASETEGYIENPLDRVLDANLLLKQVTEDVKENLSEETAVLKEYASHRALRTGTAAEEHSEQSLWNKILFLQYAMEHFSHYGSEKAAEKKGLWCELEYLVGGKNSDSRNMEVVVAQLLLIREADNYLTILQDEGRVLQAHELAAIATAALAAWMEPVVCQAILLYWAYEDSVEDLQTLLEGGKIPLIKSLPLEAISGFTLGYEEYLSLLLLLQKQEQLAMRSMDIIEMNVRQENPSFEMDACIGKAVVESTFQDLYGKSYYVSGMIQYVHSD